MFDAAREAIQFAKGRTRSDLDNDRMLVLSLIKDIEISGEAAYQVSDEIRDRYSEIPWEDIIGMRHRLVHAYLTLTSTSSGKPFKMILLHSLTLWSWCLGVPGSLDSSQWFC